MLNWLLQIQPDESMLIWVISALVQVDASPPVIASRPLPPSRPPELPELPPPELPVPELDPLPPEPLPEPPEPLPLVEPLLPPLELLLAPLDPELLPLVEGLPPLLDPMPPDPEPEPLPFVPLLLLLPGTSFGVPPPLLPHAEIKAAAEQTDTAPVHASAKTKERWEDVFDVDESDIKPPEP